MPLFYRRRRTTNDRWYLKQKATRCHIYCLRTIFTELRNEMGKVAVAALEIDTFRLEAWATVLNVQAVKKFLASLSVGAVTWYSPNNDKSGYEDSVNRPDGGPIDEELRVSGIILWSYKGKIFELCFATRHRSFDEYVGNRLEHSLVIQFKPPCGKPISIPDFIDGCQAVLELKEWLILRKIVSHRLITNSVTTVTT